MLTRSRQKDWFVYLPTTVFKVVKVDCGKAKPQLLNQVEGTSPEVSELNL
ncbi:hypothetical protein NIB75_03305 [Bacteroides uniformis]|nr:hypothetical protein [Bacteroides uniformis]